MSGYNTKQRRALLAFLGEHPDELLTARQMADALAEKQISLSAVYRNLAQLEAEEQVRRSAKSGSHEAFYQYLDAKGCKGALHMSCVKCGKTFHMASGNANHDCSGDDCAICRQISICENLLKSLGLAGAAAAITAAFTYTMCRAILPCAETIGTLTLVALKVKLSN